MAEKDVAFPTDAKLIHKARERLVKQAKRAGIISVRAIRGSARTLIQHQRYAHAKQFKRANRQLRKLKTFLGRTIRDIGRKINGAAALEAAFLRPLWLGERVMTQKKRDPLPKIYGRRRWNALERARPTSPEFGVKVSVATTLPLQRRAVPSTQRPCRVVPAMAIRLRP